MLKSMKIGIILLSINLLSVLMCDGEQYEIGQTTIDIPTYENYVDLRYVSHKLNNLYQLSAFGNNKILATLIPIATATELLKDESYQISTVLSLQTNAKLENILFTKKQFAQYRQMMRTSLNEAYKALQTEIENHVSNYGDLTAAYFEEKIESLGGFVPMGIYYEKQNVICMAQITRINTTLKGSDKNYIYAASAANILINHKIIYLYVFKRYQTEKDLKWTKTTLLKWVETIFESKRNNNASSYFTN